MSALNEITELTEVNDHTEALILGIKYLLSFYPDQFNEEKKADFQRDIYALREIQTSQKRFGYIPSYEFEDRQKIYHGMMDFAKSFMPNSTFKKFYGSF